ncbi:Uncharacterised protein [Achromobacter xylosoxidans]|nr:Uncharacterised protein [Achromobacter xylosoxidans]
MGLARQIVEDPGRRAGRQGQYVLTQRIGVRQPLQRFSDIALVAGLGRTGEAASAPLQAQRYGLVRVAQRRIEIRVIRSRLLEGAIDPVSGQDRIDLGRQEIARRPDVHHRTAEIGGSPDYNTVAGGGRGRRIGLHAKYRAGLHGQVALHGQGAILPTRFNRTTRGDGCRAHGALSFQRGAVGDLERAAQKGFPHDHQSAGLHACVAREGGAVAIQQHLSGSPLAEQAAAAQWAVIGTQVIGVIDHGRASVDLYRQQANVIGREDDPPLLYLPLLRGVLVAQAQHAGARFDDPSGAGDIASEGSVAMLVEHHRRGIQDIATERLGTALQRAAPDVRIAIAIATVGKHERARAGLGQTPSPADGAGKSKAIGGIHYLNNAPKGAQLNAAPGLRKSRPGYLEF